jgi:DNA-binding PucR family transcriptional regulator
VARAAAHRGPAGLAEPDENANEVAAALHVHPQTVRHRLRRLTDLFGDQLRDPRRRFELEPALRAER